MLVIKKNVLKKENSMVALDESLILTKKRKKASDPTDDPALDHHRIFIDLV